MDFIEKTLEFLERQIPFVVVRVYSAPHIGTQMLVVAEQVVSNPSLPADLQASLTEFAHSSLQNRKSQNIKFHCTCGDIEVYCEVFLPDETILIVGAGHIAVPLCSIAKTLGFRVVIMDDREDYAHQKRFPQADQIIIDFFAEGLRQYPLNPYTYIVLVTRGHTYDKVCLREILTKANAYIGMIGSYRRLQAVFKALIAEGYSSEQLAQVHGPIGLPIGAITPEELAISILSEIISVRHQGAEWSLSLKDRFRKNK